MFEPIEIFIVEHLLVLLAGGISLFAAAAVRNYGRRLERQTRDRGFQLLDQSASPRP